MICSLKRNILSRSAQTSATIRNVPRFRQQLGMSPLFFFCSPFLCSFFCSKDEVGVHSEELRAKCQERKKKGHEPCTASSTKTRLKVICCTAWSSTWATWQGSPRAGPTFTSSSWTRGNSPRRSRKTPTSWIGTALENMNKYGGEVGKKLCQLALSGELDIACWFTAPGEFLCNEEVETIRDYFDEEAINIEKRFIAARKKKPVGDVKKDEAMHSLLEKWDLRGEIRPTIIWDPYNTFEYFGKDGEVYFAACMPFLAHPCP